MTAKAKEIIFEQEAREALKNGIDQIADVVSITLGPKGRNVGLQSSFGSPTITSDGCGIAQDIEVKDRFVNLGVSLGKEVASKIKETAGDGTTTGIVLLRALVREGMKNIAAGANPTALKRGMDAALEKVLSQIDGMAAEVKGGAETLQVATVSASGNREVGEKIAECFAKVGKNGVIAIEEGKKVETEIELVEGMQFSEGYISPYFVTQPEKMIAELHNPAILLTDKKISSIQEILPLLQTVVGSGRELLIIAEGLEGDALSTLVINKLKGHLKIAAVKAPGFGEARKALLEDLAILTGGELISEERGLLLREADPSALGSATQVLITKEKTTIVGGGGKRAEIEARVRQLEEGISKATSSYDEQKLQERRGKLQGGVALIKVGAPTESEMKKKKQMFEDSLGSTRLALHEGIVPGGGVALLKSGSACDLPSLPKEEAVGAQILKKALEAPFRQIVSNSGFDPSLLLEEVLHKGKNFGFNALTEQVEDLLQAGVIDPASVVKNSLTIAASVAGVVWLSEALIADGEETES